MSSPLEGLPTLGVGASLSLEARPDPAALAARPGGPSFVEYASKACFEAVAAEHPDVKFVKVNTDEEGALAGHFGIRSIPTLMIFREQVIVFQQPGALPKGAVEDVLRQVRGLDMVEVKRGSRPHEAGDAHGED